MVTVIRPDICVIGAGSGGLSVAAAAAAFGVETVLVERGKMGGDCLNYGCVPSKALIAAAKRAHAFRTSAPFGIAPAEPAIDFAAVNAHVHQVIAAIAPNDSVERFTGLGVRVVEAEGRFTDRDTLVAGGMAIKARRFVIAAGSSPILPPIEGIGDVDALTNETIFDLEELPGHLIIVGGGPIGLELAQAHRRLGSEVTVIEGQAALSREDPELARMAIESLRSEAIEILENHKVERVGRVASGIRVTVSSGNDERSIDGTHLLVAAGRVPNVDALNLDAAGVAHDKKGVTVDAGLRSTNKRIYAIGDVAGGPQFTHVANYHAGIVIRALLFRLPAKVDYAALPRATFLDPELAQVGLSEAEAREKHGEVIRILRWPVADNDRAQTERATTGLIKLVASPRGKLLGVSILAANASEMANFWSLALGKKMTLRDITSYISPYPTIGEIGKRAAVSYFADMAQRPIVKRIVRLLQRFG